MPLRVLGCAAQMLLKHPLPFSHNVHKAYEPALPVQTSRNLEAYVDPFDPTVGEYRRTIF